MTITDKLNQIARLDEKSLREAVLLPLLSRMGIRAATIYHGPSERGKDIVGFALDHFGNREYVAVVAKVADLDGSVSSSSSLRQVLFKLSSVSMCPMRICLACGLSQWIACGS